MRIPLFQVDAFTDRPFSGNPAAVCLLDRWLEDELLQSIAAENNLSETAFLVPRGEDYHLRWFTPTTEVDLCGHATLASAFVLWNELERPGDLLRFWTRSGILSVKKEGGLLALSLPIQAPTSCDPPPQLTRGLGREPAEVWAWGQPERPGNYLAVYRLEEEVAGLAPSMEILRGLPGMGVIVTAPGRTVDFVSRYFAPAWGVPEDPVTGSSHCTLVPFWARRMGKKTLHARQISTRGGELFCRLESDLVVVAGHAVCCLVGELRF